MIAQGKLIMDFIIAGITACLAMDIFQRVLQIASGQPPSNWAIVGRWAFNVLQTARLYQPYVDSANEIKGEHAFGWVVHYAVGIGYAVVYKGFMQTGLLTANLSDGLIFGFLSVFVPWFFFLPVMGKGVMGMKTPEPAKVCMLALANLCVRRDGSRVSTVCLKICRIEIAGGNRSSFDNNRAFSAFNCSTLRWRRPVTNRMHGRYA